MKRTSNATSTLASEQVLLSCRLPRCQRTMAARRSCALLTAAFMHAQLVAIAAVSPTSSITALVTRTRTNTPSPSQSRSSTASVSMSGTDTSSGTPSHTPTNSIAPFCYGEEVVAASGYGLSGNLTGLSTWTVATQWIPSDAWYVTRTIVVRHAHDSQVGL